METANIKVIEGKLPILLSAPHCQPHKRPRLNFAYRQGECWTRDIVNSVCDSTGTNGIYILDEVDYDPNFHKVKRNPYKQIIRDLVKEKKIQYMIDIHGIKDSQDYDVGIYYPTRFSKSIEFANKIAEGIAKGELRGLNVRIFRFLDNEQETIGEYCASKLRIPSIQIEIAKYIRDDEDLRNSIVKNLSSILTI